MSRFRDALLASLALAAPALADPATDYDRLLQALPSLTFASDPGVQLQGQAMSLKRRGRWACA